MTAILRVALGLGLIGLVIWLRGGVGDIVQVLEGAGWLGILLVTFFHYIPMALCGVAWRVMLPDAPKGALVAFVHARWVRDAINQLLPFMPLGGEVIGARMIAARGVGGSMAAALTVVDITAEVMSQTAYSLIGVAMWLDRSPEGGVLTWAVLGAVITLPMLLGLLLAQKLGLVRWLEKLADKVMPAAWKTEAGDAASIHDTIVTLYAQRGRFALATAIHLAGWLTASCEAWLALRVIGAPISIGDALALESVIYAVRNAAFLVPGGLGVQEGAYALVGAALGLPPEAALALAVIKRGRELLMGVPAILSWQWLGRKKPDAIDQAR